MAPSDPKVMELDEDPTIKPDPLVDWRMPYLDYLLREALPTDKMEAWRLARRAKSFVVIEGELYRRSHTEILQCKRNAVMFCRGIGESSLPTSPRWSTRVRV